MKRNFIFVVLVAASLQCPLVFGQDPQSTPALEMVTYYFVLLSHGANWSPAETPERAEIQAAHLANIRRLHDAGKLVLAGPFTDNSNLSGLFILKAASMEEAKALVQTDPAVQAGRLSPEIHPWMTQRGILP